MLGNLADVIAAINIVNPAIAGFLVNLNILICQTLKMRCSLTQQNHVNYLWLLVLLTRLMPFEVKSVVMKIRRAAVRLLA